MNARNPTFSIVFFLKATSSGYSGNLAKMFIFNAIGAKFFYQFFKFCHLVSSRNLRYDCSSIAFRCKYSSPVKYASSILILALGIKNSP